MTIARIAVTYATIVKWFVGKQEQIDRISDLYRKYENFLLSARLLEQHERGR